MRATRSHFSAVGEVVERPSWRLEPMSAYLPEVAVAVEEEEGHQHHPFQEAAAEAAGTTPSPARARQSLRAATGALRRARGRSCCYCLRGAECLGSVCL